MNVSYDIRREENQGVIIFSCFIVCICSAKEETVAVLQRHSLVDDAMDT